MADLTTQSIADVRNLAIREAQAAIAVQLSGRIREATKDPGTGLGQFDKGYIQALSDAMLGLESVRVYEPE
jgi:hypothetical protein